jgi:hypothetical protein
VNDDLKPGPFSMPIDDADIEKTIFELLDARAPGKTICPSEVARNLAPDDWRPLMPQVRAVAFALADKTALRILQKGEAVPHDSPIRGPIRLGRRADGADS